SREIAHQGPRHPVRGALPAVPAGRIRALAAGDGPAADPVPPVALETTRHQHLTPPHPIMRIATPHLLWLLLAVPAAVIAYALYFTQRRRLLARLGNGPMIERMIASTSVTRKVVRAIEVVAALALIALALARPQAGGRAKLTKQPGLDLVV